MSAQVIDFSYLYHKINNNKYVPVIDYSRKRIHATFAGYHHRLR